MAIRPPSPPGAVEIPVSLSTSVGKFTSLQYWNGSVFVTVAAGGGVSWGGISGTLSDQTDLNNALTSINNVISAMSSTFTTSVLNVTGEASVQSIHGKFWKAADSGGAYIISNSNTTVATFGAGGGSNFTFDGGVKHNSLDADRILGLDSGKNLVALSTATYPSLTELSYLKGVTSSVQDQVTTLTSAIVSVQDVLTSTNSVVTNLNTSLTSANNAHTSTNNYLMAAVASVNELPKIFYQTDCLGPGVGNEVIWGFVNAGGAGTATYASPTDAAVREHPGIISLNRTTTNPLSGAGGFTQANGILLRGGESANFVVMPVCVGETNWFMGLHDSTNTTIPSDGAFFYIKSGGECQGVCRSNNVSASSGVLLSVAISAWYRFNVSISPTSASAAYFRVFDMAGSVLASANVVTNLPVGNGRMVGHGIIVYHSVSAAGTAPLAWVDYMDLTISKPVRGGV